MGNLKVSQIVLILCSCLELRSVTGWYLTDLDSNSEHACSQYKLKETLYKDVYSDGASTLYCLHPPDLTPKNMEITHKMAMGCMMSVCLVAPAENHCPIRSINGTDYPYGEINREPCTTKDGEPGYTALCCRENSEDAQLASATGAEPNEFPHMIKLSLSGQCGGTIYNKRFIVTAAHCIVNEETNELHEGRDAWYAIIGSNSGDLEDPKYRYKVINSIPHKSYSKLAPNHVEFGDKYLNDIALLELDRDITFGTHVKSLEIAPRRFEPRDYADNAVLVGWGTTNVLDIALNLQRFNLALRNGDDCFVRKLAKSPPWGDYAGYKEQLLCVGGYLNREASSFEGNGGPAVCRGADGRAVLCGVTSFGGNDTECSENPGEDTCLPSVYARVSNFHDWILDNAGEQDIDTFYKPYLYGEPVSATGEYKYHVHITSDSGKTCGGTLVAPDVVVTAASCIATGDGDIRSGVTVSYGMDDLTLDSDVVQTFNVSNTKLFDGYRISGNPVDENVQGTQAIMSDSTYKNNLAVLKLDGRAPIESNDCPGLPEGGEKFTEGNELAYLRNTTHGGKLLLRDYHILTKKECQKRLDRLEKRQASQGGGSGTQIDENHLCGVEVYSGGSICDRELGGGLICKGENGKDVLCGVQSFRLCRWSFPNIFVYMSSKPGTWAKDTIKSL